MTKTKKIIGFTTGVFDLFHIGHLKILKKAKSQCDYLIVGVTTDKFTQKYKHKTPVIPYKERCKIVKSIKYVDKVVPQTILDRNALWEKHHFDIMFHGNDILKDPIRLQLDKELTKKRPKVKVVYFPYTKGTSSTLLSEILIKIKNNL